MDEDEDEIPDQSAEAMFEKRNPVPPVAGIRVNSVHPGAIRTSGIQDEVIREVVGN